jgi:hypothetical protein
MKKAAPEDGLCDRVPAMSRAVLLVYLVSVWLTVEYPYGLLLFVFGGYAGWSLQRAQEVARVQTDPEFVR